MRRPEPGRSAAASSSSARVATGALNSDAYSAKSAMPETLRQRMAMPRAAPLLILSRKRTNRVHVRRGVAGGSRGCVEIALIRRSDVNSGSRVSAKKGSGPAAHHPAIVSAVTDAKRRRAHRHAADASGSGTGVAPKRPAPPRRGGSFYRIGAVPQRLSRRPPSAIAMTTTISSGRGASATDTSPCRNAQTTRARPCDRAARRARVPGAATLTLEPITAWPPPIAARIGRPSIGCTQAPPCSISPATPTSAPLP